MTAISKPPYLILGSAILLLAAACGGRDEGSADSVAGDTTPAAATTAAPATLTADEGERSVRTALRADPALTAFRLDTDDEGGRIVLEGDVETEAQKTQAAEIAARTAPGLTIDNQIRVVTTGRKTPNIDADEAEDRIEDAFEADSTLRAFDLDADDMENRVVLKGTVPTAAHRSQAEAIAKRIAPALRIDNQIRVQ